MEQSSSQDSYQIQVMTLQEALGILVTRRRCETLHSTRVWLRGNRWWVQAPWVIKWRRSVIHPSSQRWIKRNSRQWGDKLQMHRKGQVFSRVRPFSCGLSRMSKTSSIGARMPRLKSMLFKLNLTHPLSLPAESSPRHRGWNWNLYSLASRRIKLRKILLRWKKTDNDSSWARLHTR